MLKKFARCVFYAITIPTFKCINAVRPWHKLPRWIGVLNLMAFRQELRQENLHDTQAGHEPTPPSQWQDRYLTARSPDGGFNDLAHPGMGSAGARFGRNVPLEKVVRDPDLLSPNPRLISQKLMTRDKFQPVEALNLLAAAWIQFQVHGWVNHSQEVGRYHEIPIDPADDFPEKPMRVQRTLPESAATKDTPTTFKNTESAWWDSSQIYGSSLERQMLLRTQTGGKLTLEDGKFLPRFPKDENGQETKPGIEMTGFFDNWWIGLSLMHTLFVLEHNAICDRLAAVYPQWTDQQLFDKARLINCAVIARIHTIEWTPAILQHPVLKIAMNANWYGLLGEVFYKKFGRLGSGEVLSGIPGSPPDHHTAPYAMTEEFVSVYRLHPLIPDDYRFVNFETGKPILESDFEHVQGQYTADLMRRVGLRDMYFSFGIAHPGAITLHNFPRGLHEFRKAKLPVMDLAAVDILRDRERGVPRYNEFRRQLHMKPFRSFSELTANRDWAIELREIYGDVEKVDTLVGMLAETAPKGFGFSDTAFRIFILMASRRLKSDRFFTTDYTEDVYTPLGMDWINNTTMADVIRRHLPDLGPAINPDNAFFPWKAK